MAHGITNIVRHNFSFQPHFQVYVSPKSCTHSALFQIYNVDLHNRATTKQVHICALKQCSLRCRRYSCYCRVDVHYPTAHSSFGFSKYVDTYSFEGEHRKRRQGDAPHPTYPTTVCQHVRCERLAVDFTFSGSMVLDTLRRTTAHRCMSHCFCFLTLTSDPCHSYVLVHES